MRFDVHNIAIELILTLVCLIWWLKRVPNVLNSSIQLSKQRTAWIIWPGIGPSFTVSFPLESLIVNIFSLTGTVLSDELRPSQAIFSIALVLHDSWPLLFSATAGGGSVATNKRNVIRLTYVSVISLFVYFIVAVVLEWTSLIHFGAVLCGYVAGAGACVVAWRYAVDYARQEHFAVYYHQHHNYNHISGTQQQQQLQQQTENNNEESSQHRPYQPPPDHDILDSVATTSATNNSVQHIALIATYFVYGIMLIVDWSTLSESGPWFFYCSGSVFVEVMKHFWVHRNRVMNVDTVV
jgi:hypothetical protein